MNRINSLETEKKNERAVLVFCNWLVFGLIGLGFLLEGGSRENFLIGVIGIVGIIAGFVVHIIINHISTCYRIISSYFQKIFKRNFLVGRYINTNISAHCLDIFGKNRMMRASKR